MSRCVSANATSIDVAVPMIRWYRRLGAAHRILWKGVPRALRRALGLLRAGGTSKRTELKLTDTARFSLEELRRDYRDYLRQRGLKEWSYSEPLRQELIDARCASAEEVAQWVREVRARPGRNGRRDTYAEIAANAALVLIAVACSLLDRQLASLGKRFLENGGFTERMYRMRGQRRRQEPPT